MNSLSIGDMAQSFLSRQQSVALRSQMNALTYELASGQVYDVSEVLSENFSYLSDIENGLRTMDGYRVAGAEASQYAQSLQGVLGSVQSIAGDFSGQLLTVSTGGNDSISLRSAAEARQHLDSIVGTLNTNIGGRNLLSGTATGTAPISSAQDLIDAVRTELTGVVGSAAKIAAAEAWFDDPAGFEATIYQGSQDALSPFRLSQSENLELDVRATDDALKDMLRHVTMAALSDDATLAISATERQEILYSAGEGLLGNQDSLIALRSTVGTTQARMDEITTRNAAEKLSLDFARSSLLTVDPFETATRLEEVQFQLQTLYTLTVKSSQLSLVNFL